MAFELDPCRVYGATGELIAEGFVREHSRDEVLVEAEHYSGRWLEPGDEAIVQVLSPTQGECIYDGVISSSETRRIEVGGLVLRERVQKRSAVRVATAFPVTLTEVVQDGTPAPLDEPEVVTVIDLSAHGLRFRSRREFEPGTLLPMRLTVTRVPMDVVARVLRHHELGADVAHGCLLVDPPERVTDELFRFVMEEQRRQLAERRAHG